MLPIVSRTSLGLLSHRCHTNVLDASGLERPLWSSTTRRAMGYFASPALKVVVHKDAPRNIVRRIDPIATP